MMCGICRHELPGHDQNCPVYTGFPVPGVYPSQQSHQQQYINLEGINPQDLQPMNQFQGMQGIGPQIQGEPGAPTVNAEIVMRLREIVLLLTEIRDALSKEK